MPTKTTIFIVIAAIVIIPLLIFFRIIPGRQVPALPSAVLSFWGIDDSDVWRQIIEDFHEQFPTITITYTQLNSSNYEDVLINKIAEGKGPDMFMLPNTLLFKHRDKIYPFPQQALKFTSRDFVSTFVDGTYEELVDKDGSIYGLPLFIDTLALFYNKDMLNAAGIARIPANWDDLASISRTLVQKNNAGEVIRSGLALGTARTIDNSFEILSSLILQQQDPIIQRAQRSTVVMTAGGVEALTFYTSFANPANPNFSWSDHMPNSLTAFAETNAGFSLGFYDDITRIRAKNPHLNIGIASFPQQKGTALPIVFGRYMFPTVSKYTQYPLVAWQFIAYAADKKGANIYIRNTERPPAHRDLLNMQAPSADLDTFYRQALIAKSWPVPDDKPTRRLFQDAIEAVVSGTLNPFQSIDNLKRRLDLLISEE